VLVRRSSGDVYPGIVSPRFPSLPLTTIQVYIHAPNLDSYQLSHRYRMAFLVIGAIHQAVRGVQSGIQAHKDFKSPVHVVDPTSPVDRDTRAPVDRYGHAKEHHPVYGWVMKAEHKFNKGKGKERDVGGSSSEREVGMNKKEHENQSNAPPTDAHQVSMMSLRG
jgi:hypothetical protein